MTDKQERMLKHWKSKALEGHGEIVQCFIVDGELFCEFLIKGRKSPIYIGVSKTDYSARVSEKMFNLYKNKIVTKII